MFALILQFGCESVEPRPTYQQLWSLYGPSPDCLNRDIHIKYLESLKVKPLRNNDLVSVEQYDKSIDLYVERLQWYCKEQY